MDAAIPPLGQREQGPRGELVLCECRWLPSGVSVGSGEASATLHGQGKAKGGTRAGSIDDPQGRDPRASGPGAPSAAPGGGGDRDLVGMGLRANIPGVELFWV